MTNYGPWSVKGIDQRAREAAREAAREEGLTIGEYINRMLLEETGGEAPSARDDSSPRYPRPEPSRPDLGRPQTGAGPANDLIRELVARIEAVETRSSLALSGIDRSISDLAQRLDGAQKEATGKVSSVETVLGDIRSTHDVLRDKVRALEEDKSKPGNLQALKSLERALGKLANHVYQESAAQKDQAAAIRSRVETGLEDMGKRLSGMEGQIETRLGEASEQLARNVEQAELRTEGATRHLSSRFTELEAQITGKLARVDGFSERVEKVENGLSQKAGAFDTRLTELRARLERAETATDAALVNLEKTFGALNERVEDIASKALPEAARALREQFDSRFEGLASELRTSIEHNRRQLAAEIEDVSARSASKDDVALLNTEVDAIRDQAGSDRSEAAGQIAEVRENLSADIAGLSVRAATHDDVARLGSQLDTLRDDVRSGQVAADQRLADTREKLTGAIDKVSNEAARSEDVARIAEAIEALRQHIDNQKDAADRRLEEARQQLAGEIEHVADKAVSPETVAGVQASLSSLREQLAKNEESAGRTLERVTEQITRISTGLSRRIKQVEDKDCMREVEDLRGRLDKLSGDVASQLESSGSQTSAVIDRITAEMREMAERFDTRIDESEQRSATAIEQIGEQVSGVANRLNARQERSFRELEQTIETERKQQQKSLADALNGVSERIEKMQEESRTSLSPVQKALSSLATRLETFEDTGASRKEADEGRETRRADLDDFLSDAPLESRRGNRKESRAEPAPQVRKEQDFDGDLPFLEDFDDASAAGGAGMYEYESDLPDDDADQDAAAFSSWDDASDDWNDGASAATDDDAFEGGRPAADESWGLAANEGGRRTSRASGNDYLSRARQAALHASEVQPAKSKKAAKKAKPVKPAKQAKQAKPGQGSKSKLPLVAAVSVIALATATAGALYALRGMQDDNPRPTVQTRDSISLASVATVGETGVSAEDVAAEDLDMEGLPAGVSGDEVPGEASETVNAVQAPAQPADEDADLFEEDAPADIAGPTSPLAGLAPIPAPPTLQSAADEGDPVAQFLLGQQRLDAGDYTAGPTLVRRAADQDLAAAQYRLAKLHEKGLGVPRDLSMAREWTERAARGGNVKAMHDLAVYYAQGDGGPQSSASAADWFRRAADYGVTDSQFNLALFYETGTGISQDTAEALFWYTVAADSGDTEAPAKVEELTSLVSAQEAASAKQQAARWSAAQPDRAANGTFPAQAWQGQSTAQVKAVQATLDAMGYEPGPADGLLGAGTIDAINAYQVDNGLEQTGKVTAPLIESLNAAIRDARG